MDAHWRKPGVSSYILRSRQISTSKLESEFELPTYLLHFYICLRYRIPILLQDTTLTALLILSASLFRIPGTLQCYHLEY
jgi:hypothetical protein